MKKKNCLLGTLVASVLIGCAQAPKEKVFVLENSEWLDKPTNIELVELAAVQPTVLELETDKTGQKKSGTNSKRDPLPPLKDRELVDGNGLTAEQRFQQFNEQLRAGESASYVAESATYIMETDVTYDFSIYESESYLEALNRWLGDQGYRTIGTLLDPKEVALLRVKADKRMSMDTSLPTAIDALIDDAKEKDIVFEKRSLSQEEIDALYLRVELDADARTAIITSSKVPVTMFVVQRGSLFENYKALAEHYHWEASSHKYMARQYRVPFSYPIVTESANIKRALTQLLDGFPRLRGAVVPSTREIYVLEEVR